MKRFLTVVMVIVLSLGMPAAAVADALPAASPSVPAATGSTGVSQPTGASASTYHFNAISGLWENDYYTWNPLNQKTVPKVAPEYTYNQTTGLWDTAIWEYDTVAGKYVVTSVSLATPPSGALTHGGPVLVSPTSAVVTTPAATVPVGSTSPANSVLSAVDSPASLQPVLNAHSEVAPSLNIPSTINQIAGNTSPVTNINLNTGVTLATTVNSSALSGDAVLRNNKKAGDATTGDASAAATVLNLLQSSASLGGSGFTTFTKDIQGDINGDFLIDPAAFMQPAGTSNIVVPSSGSGQLAVTSKLNGTIQNDINLLAVSGDATIADNKKAGSATTGDASAVASVLNLINSVVAANQSFVGVINIYGNYTGDILVPSDSLQALLAGNETTASAPVTAVNTVATDTNKLATTSNQHIQNNVDLSAVSGNALLADNKHAGNVSTGDALTKLTILNLTGHQVTAANSLLVFVNVLGTWVGVIMDAPAGTTAAALAGGNVEDTVAQTMTNRESDVQLADTTNIINNITAHAQSGDATATGNKRVGNATTGNATASASIANIVGSSFSLSHWFGVLFINVFGAWHGNFGTAAPVILTGNTGGIGNGSTTAPIEAVRVFNFVPAGANPTSTLSPVSARGFGSSTDYNQFVESVGEVLAAHDVVRKFSGQVTAPSPAQHQKRFSINFLPVAVGLTGLTVVGAERIRSIRHKLTYRIFR